MADTKKVTLRAGTHTQDFQADHAERLLAYPGTQWAKLEPEKAVAKQIGVAGEAEGDFTKAVNEAAGAVAAEGHKPKSKSKPNSN